MRKYLGEFIYEVRAQDIGTSKAFMLGLGGGPFAQVDVGCRLYKHKGILQIETPSQRDNRRRQENEKD